MTITTQNYNNATPTTIAMDLSGFAASATFVAVRSSAEVDNTATKYVKALVYGRFIVGTTPTLPCQFNVYVWGADISLGTKAIDTLVGTDANKTLTNTTVLNASLIPVRSPQILDNTSNLTYDIAPFELTDYLGVVPPFWGIVVAHNMTAALKTDANNTNQFRFHGITYAHA